MTPRGRNPQASLVWTGHEDRGSHLELRGGTHPRPLERPGLRRTSPHEDHRKHLGPSRLCRAIRHSHAAIANWSASSCPLPGIDHELSVATAACHGLACVAMPTSSSRRATLTPLCDPLQNRCRARPTVATSTSAKQHQPRPHGERHVRPNPQERKADDVPQDAGHRADALTDTQNAPLLSGIAATRNHRLNRGRNEGEAHALDDHAREERAENCGRASPKRAAGNRSLATAGTARRKLRFRDNREAIPRTMPCASVHETEQREEHQHFASVRTRSLLWKSGYSEPAARRLRSWRKRVDP